MNDQRAVVAIIDDEEVVREALRGLLETVELKVDLFRSVDEFLRAGKSHEPNCIVLDVRLPGPSGLEFQTQLAAANSQTPIVFITGHGDIPMSVHAMKAGAIDFLTKPFRDQDLIDAVRRGIMHDRARRAEEMGKTELRTRFATLTPCERETMALLTAGRSAKQIAGQMGVSAVTARVHRSHIMRKMGARSVADLVRMADKLDAPLSKQPSV
jgi:FixJ family two-component response regulator